MYQQPSVKVHGKWWVFKFQPRESTLIVHGWKKAGIGINETIDKKKNSFWLKWIHINYVN